MARAAPGVRQTIRHSASHLSAGDFAYVGRIARTNFAGEGPLAAEFRQRLAAAFGRSGAVLANSGTAALELALHQLRQAAPNKRHVAVSAYVCPAVVNAILREGLKPLFADVQDRSMNLDVEKLRPRIDDRVLAVILTHVGGVPDDCAAAATLGVPVISDCAQGVGAVSAGMPVTQCGTMAVLSFGSTKPFTAGTGGAVLIDDAAMLEGAIRHATSELDEASYRQGGFRSTYGQHFPDLNAGLGLAQLKRFGSFLRRRRAIARRYDKVLATAGCEVQGVASSESERNGFRYFFLSDRAAAWIDLLRQAGIDARPSIAHDMTTYVSGLGRLANIRANAPRMVSVPIHPALSEADIQSITAALGRGIEAGLR